ncbi:MAG: biotin--[acetyl-CoA-carboxylase] ligase [Myxococcales bacterium]|nr:biotin--[acetyl-CoA-carboxylase] ligase [Myxococcales bacterium]
MRITWLEHCESTQDELAQASKTVTAIASLNQSAGRGRHGRIWQSPQGAGLALSWRAPVDDLAIEDLPLLSLASGLALHRSLSTKIIQQTTSPKPIEDLALKWPNDLLFQKRKLAGILCEGKISSHGHSVLVGIGLNLVRHADISVDYATLDELGLKFKSSSQINHLCQSLINELDSTLNELKSSKSSVLEEWQKRSLALGTDIKAAGQQGIYRGIDQKGALLLDIGDQLISVESGEVHL